MDAAAKPEFEDHSAENREFIRKPSTIVMMSLVALIFAGIIFWLIADRVDVRAQTCTVTSAQGVSESTGKGMTQRVLLHTRECGEVTFNTGVTPQNYEELGAKYDTMTTCEVRLSWLQRVLPEWVGPAHAQSTPVCQ